MLDNILTTLSASPNEIMDVAEDRLKQLNYETFREPTGLFLLGVPPSHGTITPVPMLVSHVDVVGTVTPKLEDLVITGKKISLDSKSKASVLGADDRAGVYAMFNILSRIDMNLPFVALTDLEEVGGVGAGALVKSGLLDPYKEEISLYIELDRRGVGEFVSYDDSGSPNKEIEILFETYGFKLGHGSYSDVADFTSSTNTTNVNLSVGYRNEHTKGETLFLDDLELTTSRLLSIWANSDLVFSKVFEAEESIYDDSWVDYDRSYRWGQAKVGGGKESVGYAYEELFEEFYDLVAAAELSEDVELIANMTYDWVESLPPRLAKELAASWAYLIDDFCMDEEDSIHMMIVSTLTDILEDESDEASFELDENTCGWFVDAKGRTVFTEKENVCQSLY